MQRVKQLIRQQSELLLNNNRRALVCALIFLFIPYLTWVTSGIIALFTLRNGMRNGLSVLVPIIIVHGVWSSMTLPDSLVLINTLLMFVPGYIAACALYITNSWQIVASVLVIQVLLLMLFLQWCMPEFVQAHFVFVMNSLQHTETNNAMTDYLQNMNELSQHVLVNYVLGVQVVSVVIYTLLGLIVARGVQSWLFYPQGLKQELLSFGACRLHCILLLLIIVAALQQHVLAVNILPVVLFFFILAGMSLCANQLEKKKIRKAGLVLTLPLLVLPFVIGPIYISLGFLDGFFRFRSKVACS